MEPHDLVDRLVREVAILAMMSRTETDDPAHLGLMVDQAKRARRASTILIRALARERDNDATAQEAQANE